MTMIKVKHKVIYFDGLIQVEIDETVLNDSTSQPVTSKEINQMIESNQNESLKQTKLKLNQVLVA